MRKSFKSINQQIKILQNRGMVFDYYELAKFHLKTKNYYNLINGMKELLIDKTDSTKERYKKNLSFVEVIAVFNFDRDLRTLFLKYILVIESELRTHIAYEFSRLESPYSWDDTSAFNYSSPQHRIYVNELISKLNSNAIRTQNDSHDDMLNHFASIGEKIPIWALINTFDFGTLKRFYLNAKDNLKDEIRKYYSLTPSQLRGFLEALNMYRNVCAHDFRILFYRIYDFDKKIPNMNVHANLKIPKNSSNQYLYGKDDLFSIVIVFRYMLSNYSFRKFYKELSAILRKVKHNTKVISFSEILKSIGFPQKTNNQYKWTKIKTVAK